MKDLGPAKFVLGMRIIHDQEKRTLSIDQSHYIKKVLERFGMSECKPAKTPMDVSAKLTNEMSPSNEESRNEMKNIPYQSAVGSILFVAQITRPDIQYAVGAVSRFNNNPGIGHWTAVKRILRYLKGTTDLKLNYTKDKNYLTGYSDSDWASDPTDRRSTTGYIFKLSGGAISWSSKKQQTIALSTAEAEYMAMSATTQEAIWLNSLHDEIFGSMEIFGSI